MTNVATIRYDEDSQRYGDGGIKKCATSSQVLVQMPFMIFFPLDQIPFVALIGRDFKAVQHMKVWSGLSALEVGRSVEIWITWHHWSASLIVVHLRFISSATWNCPGLVRWKSPIRIMSRGRRIGLLG
jgi:hypothetical protein